MTNETNEEMNKVNEAKQPIEQVLGTVLQMTQYMQQMVNLEAAKILHESGWCKEYIDGCPVCAKENEEPEGVVYSQGDEEE
tara:strand:+ start:398 stop:640 length:243 start_codon:yes stop_codon:yes gene_type:complete